jgi:tripartite-type tricarboxylate transporter receptor subunit TctC
MKKILLLISFLVPTLSYAWEPSKPITVLVGYGPGSGNELSFRGVAAEIEKTHPKVNFVVKNMPGSDGVLAANELAKSPADGYTIHISGNLSTYVTNEAFDKQAIRYKLFADFYPILSIATSPQVIVAKTNSQVNTAKEFVEYIKNPPTNVSIAYGSNVQLLIYQLIMDKANGDTNKVKQVGYRGPMQALLDVVGGHTEFGMMPLAVAAPQINAGKVKLIAVTGDSRHPSYPNVPKISELLAGVEVMAMWNVSVPKNTPKEVVDWYVNTISKAIRSQNVKKYFDENYMTAAKDLNPIEARKVIDNLRARYLPAAEAVAPKLDKN